VGRSSVFAKWVAVIIFAVGALSFLGTSGFYLWNWQTDAATYRSAKADFESYTVERSQAIAFGDFQPTPQSKETYDTLKKHKSYTQGVATRAFKAWFNNTLMAGILLIASAVPCFPLLYGMAGAQSRRGKIRVKPPFGHASRRPDEEDEVEVKVQ